MGNRSKNAECPNGKNIPIGHFKLYSGYAVVIFSLRESYIAAVQQLYYIRLQNCPKGNITWRKPNITGAANITRRKANITEKNGNRITITVLFWQGHKAFFSRDKIGNCHRSYRSGQLPMDFPTG